MCNLKTVFLKLTLIFTLKLPHGTEFNLDM